MARDSSRQLPPRVALAAGALAAAGLLFVGCYSWGAPPQPPRPADGPGADAPAVSPPEDLMREHGVLRRVLLVYEEVIRRADAGQPIPAKAVWDAAGVIRTFVEDYHEKLEEDYLFPRFEAAGRQADLVSGLRRQHQQGRLITAEVLELAKAGELTRPADRARLVRDLREFIRLYRPHAAREDTVLFPAFRGVVSAREFQDLGEKFEDREDELFGDGGFGKMVARVAEIEKTLGIYNLEQFTPEFKPLAPERPRGIPATEPVRAKAD